MSEPGSSVAAVVVAAGRGIRIGGGMPKQYRRVGGQAVLTRTLDALGRDPVIGRIQVVIAADAAAFYDTCRTELAPAIADKLLPPVEGGATRQDSVRAGLEALAAAGAPDVVLVHDAARPFVDAGLIARAVAAGRDHGAAVPGVAVADTIKLVDEQGGIGRVRETPAREHLRAVQTPQAFVFGTLRDAHRAAAAEGLHGFTDDGALAEWAGLAVVVFAGDPKNRKITQPSDLIEADRAFSGSGEETAKDSAKDIAMTTYVTRLGTGFDVHAFTDGDHVWLGGVKIPADRGVLAHSDGDVALHALTDALLGAIADGDIGTHFPPSDEQWRGASSDRFLAHACKLVRDRGGRIDHLDITVLAEAPRIGAHRETIRARIAEICAVPLTAVSIKATTTEKLGFVGRAEGLAAQAAATIRLPEEVETSPVDAQAETAMRQG
ncbi:bifunctional 2-C-methyl-D-erythritol 4-phosphate cytidylyltransferase/2-C-methyl-D-erythritol 2,4-cyclodiphosphate synthase [Methylobacterium sp. HMF5984]|jgi:2-C-methyl-D-erythritol 4-phosphate cytidylyltransferase/2-C-methyl-D-erythritol 2,4-cyclodiphosphate synthase|uniref:bifunctional 2-C-methyl-D-erythritol 4-phosphate cytidylyltransferase/2-C-methyl-D-erythritol 2,4-cyclodiphosphate synthase n=1 Tax=unclassified Methylobacterium TaxID=2615210 RepID=UPI001FB9C969|nr:bifunctional 2-C-methyl-D-erythritol 4-phosphate cytidylyltransferase/2-C-methyl-D-erythritol 2,4-cyclodiphosphate synthase [Methylobacterium sp. E-016]MCJ2077434.1 bifunctional 2-C-methyl-D-erythritol 4-phosphate cytidylyltransferase/2-C-methyl-D-erythritol 2,4-cyclodiphosphate synthase [Methylobacterium sp. E-016]